MHYRTDTGLLNVPILLREIADLHDRMNGTRIGMPSSASRSHASITLTIAGLTLGQAEKALMSAMPAEVRLLLPLNGVSQIDAGTSVDAAGPHGARSNPPLARILTRRAKGGTE